MIYEASLVYNNDVVIKGNRCLTTPNELYQALVLRDTSEIIIHKDFADAYFTASGLSALVENSASVNPYCKITVDAEVRDFEMRAIEMLQRIKDPEELIWHIDAHPKEMLDFLHMLANAYTSTYSETLVANNKVSSLQLQCSELMKQYDDLSKDYKSLLSSKSMVEAKLGMLVGRINYSYEKDVDPSQFLQIDGKSKYAKILYIKEISRVRYVDTLIYYLKEILRTLYSVPVREVVIGPYYAYGMAQQYPHCQPSFDLSYTKLYRDDIYMPGFQPRVMEDVLKNPSNVEFLIVLDRSGFDVAHILGEGVEYIYTVSDMADNKTSAVPSRIISYSHDTLYIPFIKDFSTLAPEEKISRYSSMPIIKQLIDLLEQR